MPAGAGHDTFQDRMSARGFDPASIIAIIQALIAIFSGCFKPTPTASFSVPRIANAIRQSDSTIGFLEARRQAIEVKGVWDAASVAERQAFIDDCRE